jgi:hypothetical protein
MAVPAFAAEQMPVQKPVLPYAPFSAVDPDSKITRSDKQLVMQQVPLPRPRPTEAPGAKTAEQGENLLNLVRLFLVPRVYVARPRYYAPRRHYASRPKQQQADRTSSAATRTVKNDEPAWAK